MLVRKFPVKGRQSNIDILITINPEGNDHKFSSSKHKEYFWIAQLEQLRSAQASQNRQGFGQHNGSVV